ncbi:MAG TPA: family 16 glycoside hydrolase, partial [Pseudonocardiaceae bacterium]
MHKHRLRRIAGLVAGLALVITATGPAEGQAATARSHDLDWVPASQHGGCLGTNLGVFPLTSDTTPIMWVKSAPNDVVGDYQDADSQLSAQVYYTSDQTTGNVTYGANLLAGVLQPNATPVASLQGTVINCDTMSLSGGGWTGTASNGVLTATNGTTTINLRHVEPVLPTLGERAPEGAVTLFDGTDFSHWGAIDCNGTKDWTTIAGPVQWTIVNGAMEVVPNTCSIISRETFGSAKYHVEFRTLGTPTHTGVFPQAQYQTTILQDYGLSIGSATGNYGNQPDSKNPKKSTAVNPAIRAARPPLEWQTLDISYTAPKFESDGAPLTEARETVVLNGVQIFDGLVLDPPSGAANRVYPQARTGVNLPIMLEYHGMPVQYRNIWALPSKDGDDSPYPHVAPPEFQHPGVLVNQAQLDFVKAKVANGEQPWTDAFNAAKASDLASLSYTPSPVPTVECGSNSNPDIGCKAEQNDASAAWTDALLWYISGDQAYAQKAIQIMNAWSSTLKGGHTLSNAPVESGWTGSTWAEAAELVRYTNAGWSPTDVAAFGNMLGTQYVPNLLTGGPACFNGNWELTIAEALMNIGVFDNNKTWFDTAVAYWRDRTPTYMYLA